jgi:transcription antitermination factor NusG
MLLPTENPPARHPQRPIREATAPWWLAKVKPRQEKALAFDLLEDNVEYYLPLFTKVTRRRDNNKPRKSVLCLFPGYVCFSAAPGFERYVFKTRRVVNLVEIQHQNRFIRELEQIYHSLELGVPVVPLEDAERLLPGSPVKIEFGSLRGVTGTIIKVKNARKLILSVEGLGRAAVTVTADMVRLLPTEE